MGCAELYLLDVNVVLACQRGDHPAHGGVRSWFDACVRSKDDFGVPFGVWASYLRLTTNQRIFMVPTPLDEAFAFIDAVVAQPSHLAAEPGPRHLELTRRLCNEAGASGDLVPDAVIGAIAIEHGATVVSLDRDFARFASLTVLRPE